MENLVMYHIFSDGYDEYTQEKAVAKSIGRHMEKEGTNVRVYEYEEDSHGNRIDEECIRSFGHYPL